MKNRWYKRLVAKFGRKVPMIVAPGVGLVIGSTGADKWMLAARRTGGNALPGEHIARIPVRVWYQHVTRGL